GNQVLQVDLHEQVGLTGNVSSHAVLFAASASSVAPGRGFFNGLLAVLHGKTSLSGAFREAQLVMTLQTAFKALGFLVTETLASHSLRVDRRAA
ncbi:MAG: hypothetical protein J0L61_03565, partial [Planctomycetes bacterium]|nr:hypothetical protein [Planctomycetota bacterium]